MNKIYFLWLDQTLSLDPRIQKFKQEEKAAREAKKKEKEEAAKRAEEATKKVCIFLYIIFLTLFHSKLVA